MHQRLNFLLNQWEKQQKKIQKFYLSLKKLMDI